ncbi:MAG: hypothetical protein JRN67_14005, partial [Nitrososphaerota archaeon]|nr:hypothetical protein [Nitrososphaerota archaeon]
MGNEDVKQTMKAITIAVLAVAVSLAVGLPLTLVSGAVWSPYHVGRLQAPSYQSEQGYGGMIGGGPGNGGMMGSSGSNYNVMNTPTSTIDNSTFNTLNSLQGGVIVNRTSNTVFVGTSGVTVPVEASPLWYPQPGDYWLVYGLVNPTIVIKQGEQVNFLFINMDNETHVAAITTIAPPYSYMPMMNGMMGGGTQTATWLA